ncbi:hypothetical protein KAI92_01085 [Candidatus Parcubacteria bacterium]|nr:hypothetical protein [Candidatus Parcubacteria bacterium]
MMDLNRISNTVNIINRKIREIFETSFHGVYIKVYFLIFFILNSLIWISARYIDSEIDEEQIALHYNVESGIDYYGDIDKIYVLPMLGLLVALINFLLYINFSKHKDRKFILHILMSAVIIINIILLAGIVSIYLINFR